MVTTINLDRALGVNNVVVTSGNIGACVIIAADIKDCTIANACLATGTFTKITGIGTQLIDVNISDKDIVTGCTTGSVFGKAVTCKTAVNGATPVIQACATTAALTTLSHTAACTPDFAIQDLVGCTGFGFVTKDEGNTVLAVIANHEVRIAELETIISNFGLSA